MGDDLVTITEDFVKYMEPLFRDEKANGMQDPHFLIDLKGGGCSGFEYSFGFHDFPILEEIFTERKEDYSVYKSGDVKVAIPQSIELYFADSKITYDRLKGIQIENPNALSSCGCGNSFNLDIKDQ